MTIVSAFVTKVSNNKIERIFKSRKSEIAVTVIMPPCLARPRVKRKMKALHLCSS